jgi:hypothetical protein
MIIIDKILFTVELSTRKRLTDIVSICIVLAINFFIEIYESELLISLGTGHVLSVKAKSQG